MSGKKRNLLTLKEKIEIINIHENEKPTIRALANRFKIGKTQVGEIIRKKEEFRTKWKSGINANQKRSFFKKEGLTIDKFCYDWFLKSRSNGDPITGPLIKTKAKEIAESLGLHKFRASDGWLYRFRLRHSISLKCEKCVSEACIKPRDVCRVSEANDNQKDVSHTSEASVKPKAVSQFLEVLPSLLLGYEPENIYSCIENGLYFRSLPDETLDFTSEKCSDGKLSKERLTILHCASMSGLKEPLLVVGKSTQPRVFKKLDTKLFPATWKCTKKALMTQEIMMEWLSNFDNKMDRQKRKILLFAENSASFPINTKLNNIKIIILPLNITVYCQPFHQGIIQNFKTFYRQLILKHILSVDKYKPGNEFPKSIDLLEAIFLINNAWLKVSPTTIKNCFMEAGFKKNEAESHIESDNDLPLSVLAEIDKNIQKTEVNTEINNFLIVDQNLETEEKIILDVTPKLEEGENLDEMEVADEKCLSSFEDALKVIASLKSFAINNNDLVAFKLVENVETHFQEACSKRKQ